MVATQKYPQLWLIPDVRTEMPPPPGSDAHEHWSNVPDFPGYECSTLGRFRNSRTGQLLRGTVAHNGYVHIGLRRDVEQVWRLAHRLIAAAFLKQPQTDRNLVVNHINKDRADNRTCNLEWVTRSENAKHWLRLRG